MTGEEVLDLLSAALANVAKVERDYKSIARNDSPPRYVFVQDVIEPTDTLFKGFETDVFTYDTHSLEVHCWAKSRKGCERMRQALFAVAAYLGGGTPTIAMGASRWLHDSWTTAGYVLVVQLGIRVGLNVPTLPKTAGGDPETSVSDRTADMIDVTSVGFDPTDAVDGDGTLQPTDDEEWK